MRVTLSSPRTGVAFLPGLAAPRTLDLSSLPPVLATEIEACLNALMKQDPSAAAADSASLRDDICHVVTVELPDGEVRTIAGPPTGPMGKLVTAFRAGLRASSS